MWTTRKWRWALGAAMWRSGIRLRTELLRDLPASAGNDELHVADFGLRSENCKLCSCPEKTALRRRHRAWRDHWSTLARNGLWCGPAVKHGVVHVDQVPWQGRLGERGGKPFGLVAIGQVDGSGAACGLAV